MSSVKQTDDPCAIYTSLKRQTPTSKWRERAEQRRGI